MFCNFVSFCEHLKTSPKRNFFTNFVKIIDIILMIQLAYHISIILSIKTWFTFDVSLIFKILTLQKVEALIVVMIVRT